MSRGEQPRTVRRNGKYFCVERVASYSFPRISRGSWSTAGPATKLIRFHPEELRQITECARRSGLTPARFIRETALGTTPRPRSHAATRPLLRELARIGRCLDQLARFAQARQDAALAAQMSAALEQHQALVRHIVQHHRQKGGSTP